MIIAFVLGYVLIAFEHNLKIDKAASAILTGVVCWTILVFGEATIPILSKGEDFIHEKLLMQIGEISEIIYFLLAAMIIVELMDSYGSFEIITDKIKTTNKTKLMWIICLITFFFSAMLDNLTTAIVIAALLRKLISNKQNMWFFAGMVIIAANAGGAWSPIGDVTTIMLWVGGQITAQNIMLKVFLPSLVCLLVPLIIASFINKGELSIPEKKSNDDNTVTASLKEKRLFFWLGIGCLLSVPVYKSITHLPPYLGMLLSLSIVWTVTEILNRNKSEEFKKKFSVHSTIRKIDLPSVLFLTGILLAVASLQTAGHLSELAKILEAKFGDIYIINTFIGLLSSVVDNVPLVAGAMGMYPMSIYPVDHSFWELLAFCAGTGGSCLIIGSAAGVAIMGILKIDFMWYLKKISWLAILGYIAGILTYMLVV
jgi:Na+/H+ antiporter NhaD/arsenite permease-like protein